MLQYTCYIMSVNRAHVSMLQYVYVRMDVSMLWNVNVYNSRMHVVTVCVC